MSAGVQRRLDLPIACGPPSHNQVFLQLEKSEMYGYYPPEAVQPDAKFEAFRVMVSPIACDQAWVNALLPTLLGTAQLPGHIFLKGHETFHELHVLGVCT